MQPTHLMIARSGTWETEIRKSRFIGHVARAATEEQARAFVASIARDHWSASHNCSAWSLGEHPRAQRSSDDGEPSGTAGVPMLEVLRQRDLTDTVVVVTRYFGGTKLGAGGLIRAYSGTTAATIDHVGIVERTVLTRCAIKVGFEDAGRVEHALRTAGDEPEAVEYGERVTITRVVPPRQVDSLVAWAAELTSGRAEVTILGEVHREVPYRPGQEEDT